MKNILKISVVLLVISTLYYCNKKTTDSTETIIKGNLKILVDETLRPIVDDQAMVFESAYDAKIVLESKSETEVLQALLNNSVQVAVLSSKLSIRDSLYFVHKRKISAKQTPFAIDGIALIANKKTNDTLIDLQTIIAFMQGKPTNKIKGLVFDNPNSSTVRFMIEKAGLKTMPETAIYSFKTNEEVIKHVAQNAGMIGVVGVNWISIASEKVEKLKQNINILSVKDIAGKDYFYPSQENLGKKKYPLARNLYIINCQGYSGLGMGFASFAAGERGQRIVLKSGLAPAIMPSRNINIVKTIN